jgi:hypothetical protein
LAAACGGVGRTTAIDDRLYELILSFQSDRIDDQRSELAVPTVVGQNQQQLERKSAAEEGGAPRGDGT